MCVMCILHIGGKLRGLADWEVESSRVGVLPKEYEREGAEYFQGRP